MNLKRLLAVAYKEWREILRDRIFFLLAFGLPIVLILVFGYGITPDVENVPLALVDYDHSTLSRDYAKRYTESRYFDFKGYLYSLKEADEWLTAGKIRVAIVIPEDFQKDLLAGRAVAIQTLVDGTNTGPARTIQGYVDGIDSAANGDLQVSYIARQLGIPSERAQAILQPIRMEIRYLYNQEVRTLWDIAPSLIMFILLLTAPLLTALSVVREKETGAIYNIYASTISGAEFLAGKLLPNILISFINAVILWLMVTFYFGAPFKGNLLFFFFATLFYVICTSSMGLLISLLVRTQIAALMISVVLGFIVGIQFSGMLTPIASLTASNYVIAHFFPAMYYNTVIQGTFLKGLGLANLWPEVMLFVAYSLGLLSLCYFLFHKRTKT
ncbi:MAG: ABC transporter permease [Candidatus Competibacteraceae bacterium]